MSDDRRIIQRPGVGVTARFIQRQRLLLERLSADQPVLICVKRGQKQLRTARGDIVARAGDAVMIDGGTTFDVVNHPDGEGIYEANALVFDPSLLVREGLASSVPDDEPIVALRRIPKEVQDAFDRAYTAIEQAKRIPLEIALHRAREILAWVSTLARPFAVPRSESAVQRVRALVSEQPGYAWRSAEIARRLGMSEATLRRRMAEEQQSVSAVLAEVRMTHALTLLQATDQPVAQVALEVGYESAARFSTRFRSRFGHPPSAIRTLAQV